MAIDRVEMLRASATLTGVDFIAVSDDQHELFVYLQHEAPPAAVEAALDALTPADVTIVADGEALPAKITVTAVHAPMPTLDGRRALHLSVESPGGFGYYRLHISSAVIDPYYNDLRFSFKAACPSELDCEAAPHRCAPEASADFPVNYSARDFWSFRQALLDFAAQRYPDWQDRLEPDLGVMLVELLAALGDEFSYAQDRIAREALFETASQRRSLRSLARLVDYTIDNGSGASAWIDVTANATGALPAGFRVRPSYDVAERRDRVVFELGRGLADSRPPAKTFTVRPQRNELLPHIWDENDVCLARGATSLTLAGAHAAELVPDPAIDDAGKWVLLATRPTDPALPERRLMVRIVTRTDDVDPLTVLPITRITWDSPTPFEMDLETLVVRGNLVPATSGETRALEFRIGPPTSPADTAPQAIERVGANSSLDYAVADGRVKFLYSLPESDLTPLVWFGAGADSHPEAEVQDDTGRYWTWHAALVGEESADATEPAFTLEDGLYRRVFGVERFGKLTEHIDYASNAGATVRFGDDEFGLAPTDGTRFTVRYRIGNGRLMNVAPETLTQFDAVLAPFVDSMRNVLDAEGGRDPEPETQIRINAPQQFRSVLYRAVQPVDFEQILARDLDWVQRAGAVVRWTGSWPTVFVTPDPENATVVTPAQRAEAESLVDRVRQAGREARVMDPRYANIDLEIRVCVVANAYRGQVQEAVLLTLFGEDGMSGFFDPDNFTFGTPLSRAKLIAAIAQVPGVRAVEGIKVRRRGWFDWRDFSEYSLFVGLNELVRVANTRELPERGAVKLVMEGGA
jgi:hypothetical protein